MGDCETQHEREVMWWLFICVILVWKMKWNEMTDWWQCEDQKTPSTMLAQLLAHRMSSFFPSPLWVCCFFQGCTYTFVCFLFCFVLLVTDSVFFKMCAVSIITEGFSLLKCNFCVFISSVLRWTLCNMDLGYLKQLKGSVCTVCQS